MKTTPLFRPLLAASILAAAGAAQAQAFDVVRMYGDPTGDGAGTAGLAALFGYRYRGSDERRASVLPAFEYRWKNGWFVGTTNGIGFKFNSDPSMQYGVRVTADFGRSESRSPVLAGMGDIKARPEIGGFFNLYLSRDFNLSSTLRYGSGNDRRGAQLDLGAHYGVQLAPQWRTSLGVSATLANGAYMQSRFGVTPAQAQNSQNPVYDAGAGVRDVRVSASVTHFINAEWSLTAGLSASSLQGDAKDSPIVRERTPITGLVALGFRF
jgi:outer membrane scaffolding protein for murein synthesis (MipA/OmpV family)